MRILRFRDLKVRYGIDYSRVHLGRLIKAHKFPPPIKLVEGGNAIGWVESELDEFLRLRAKARDLEPTVQAPAGVAP